jgi:SAM-dependent methyltransferase
VNVWSFVSRVMKEHVYDPLLEHPFFYLFSQKLLGATYLRRFSLRRFCDIRENDRVVDIGCGPGYVIDYLPKVDYFGFEPHEPYIRYAKEHYGSKGDFTCGYFDESSALKLKPYDWALLFGILHHCDNATVAKLLRDVSLGLSEGGRVVAIDTCFTETQSALARQAARHDRGRFVRTPGEYCALAGPHLRVVRSETHDGLIRLPMTIHFAVLERS